MNEPFKDIMRAIGKGDTSMVAGLFRKPGGRKYLENITLILIHSLPHSRDEKEELFLQFVAVLDQMEKRIQRQDEGQQILDDVFQTP